jgi:putative redox protein
MRLIASVHLVSGDGYAQSVRTGRHTFTSDELAGNGGQDAGPAPFALVLAGLASCTSITLEMYAARKQWELGTVRVEARLLEEDGKLRIERVLHFEETVADDQRTRLLEIAEKTPVTRALRDGLPIQTSLGVVVVAPPQV